MSKRRTARAKRLMLLAYDLRMFASQIDEATSDPANQLPPVSRIDDWLSDYRDAYYAAKGCARL